MTGGVAAKSRVPVVSVPEQWDARHRTGIVVVGVDEPEKSGDLIRTALDEAHTRRAELIVVSAWWLATRHGPIPLARVDDSGWSARLQTGIDEVLATARPEHAEVPIEVHVRNVRPDEALIEASQHADLMVLGRHDVLLSGASLMGPVARKVLREASCPVLLTEPRPTHQVRRPARSRIVPTGVQAPG